MSDIFYLLSDNLSISVISVLVYIDFVFFFFLFHLSRDFLGSLISDVQLKFRNLGYYVLRTGSCLNFIFRRICLTPFWQGNSPLHYRQVKGGVGFTAPLCVCVCVCTRSLSHVWLFATSGTVAHKVPLSTEFSKQEYWKGLPFPTPGDLPDPGIEPGSLASPNWQADSLPLAPPAKHPLLE